MLPGPTRQPWQPDSSHRRFRRVNAITMGGLPGFSEARQLGPVKKATGNPISVSAEVPRIPVSREAGVARAGRHRTR